MRLFTIATILIASIVLPRQILAQEGKDAKPAPALKPDSANAILNALWQYGRPTKVGSSLRIRLEAPAALQSWVQKFSKGKKGRGVYIYIDH